jgi:MSHA biogenesis protein MshI
MQFFKKKAKSSDRVGVAFNVDQLALAHMGERDGAPYLLHCETVDVDSERDAADALIKIVKKLKLEGAQCSFVLNPKDYSLHLVEAPNVEPKEMRAAVRWKIKGLLDTKVEDAALDVFEIPKDAYRGRKMVYVVASQKSRVQQIVEKVTASGLELAVIDIPELAMKNLSTCYIADTNGVAFMDLRRTGSTMNITRNGDLYLTRRINTQLDPDVMQSAEWDTLKERLVLEIQRSLDYFESQMGQGEVTQIVIAHRQKDTRGIGGGNDVVLDVLDVDLDDGATEPGVDLFRLIGTHEFRYGRLLVDNAYGPETEDLGIPLRIEYFDGSNFVVNTDDSCTALLFDLSAPALTYIGTSYEAPLGNGDTSIEAGGDFTVTMFQGRTNRLADGNTDDSDDADRPFITSAPLGENTGRVLVEFDLGDVNLPTSLDFLRYDWRGDADDYDEIPNNNYNNNPRGIVEFGTYRGHDRVINWQEIYIGAN